MFYRSSPQTERRTAIPPAALWRRVSLPIFMKSERSVVSELEYYKREVLFKLRCNEIEGRVRKSLCGSVKGITFERAICMYCPEKPYECMECFSDPGMSSYFTEPMAVIHFIEGK